MRHGFRNLPNDQLINGQFGAIGGSIPVAIGASIATKRRAIAFIGDGAFGYYSSELDTSVRYGAHIAVVVGSDGRWGSEWHLQQKIYGGRTYQTELHHRDCAALAAGWGARGATACSPSELRDVFADHLGAHTGPSTTCTGIRTSSAPSPTDIAE